MKTDHSLDDKFIKVQIPITNASHCSSSSPELAKALSSNTFCAGVENESNSICSGYPGNGFHTVDEPSASATIQGMLSGPTYENGCNRQLSIYTRVSIFVDWIDKIMAQTNEMVWQNVEMNCIHKPLEGDIWV